MSELKIKVGLELDDDIKELIHKEIIRQLKEDSNFSIITYGDNWSWSEVHKDGESSISMYTPEGLIFNTDERYAFKKENTVDEKLKQLENYISALQSKISMLMNK